ncbi:MAG: hypothetical protein JWP83_4468, partial [Mycobacterium sp.]|nr:hypothetical protein [Mycobacterium sp.]
HKTKLTSDTDKNGRLETPETKVVQVI